MKKGSALLALMHLFILVISFFFISEHCRWTHCPHLGAIALSYPPRVRAIMVKLSLSASFFHNESSITIGRGVRKCNSAPHLLQLIQSILFCFFWLLVFLIAQIQFPVDFCYICICSIHSYSLQCYMYCTALLT